MIYRNDEVPVNDYFWIAAVVNGKYVFKFDDCNLSRPNLSIKVADPIITEW